MFFCYGDQNFYEIIDIPVVFSWRWRCEMFQKPVLIQNETIVSENISSRENKLSQNNVTLPISPLLLKPKLRIYLLSDLSLFKSLQPQFPA